MEIPFRLFELFIGRRKAGILRFLIRKGLGGAEARKAAFQFLIDVGSLFLGCPGSPAHSVAHGHDHDQENRDHHRHHNSQLPAN